VRIDEDSGRAMPHCGAREFKRAEHTTLDVEMRVYEAGNDVLPRNVERIGCRGRFRHTRNALDQPVLDEYVAGVATLRDYVNDGAAAQYEVCTHGSSFQV
jgi:hypothetical protein